MNKKIIILIGPPCSGKSTIGKTVANELSNTCYISSGDIARKMAEQSNTIKNDLDNGKLAPEEMMRSNILSAIDKAFKDNKTIILDGFPRFYDQLKFLHEMIPINIEIKLVLMYTRLSTIIERSIARNRSDDKSLEQRLEYYYNTTYKELQPYIDYIIGTDEFLVSECARLLVAICERGERGGSKNC